ncbi:hypothetical protein EI982_15020 [Haloplanus rallus]|uniref:Uncharacterized protein n=1 Tax=Haloplanus rallus TaxID=1816183 RepID=A0A6B9FB25_9EURY|nr:MULTISPECIES: hypothetical protein [Haloplanus]QGX95997.1 hypothetical protein EI982_15020 [Haloplanus rallus]
MTFEELRTAAIDRALVGDDPEPALALAGVVDAATPDDDGDTSERPVDPLAATLLAIGSLAAERDRSLDERAWVPGTDADPFVLAGAAAAVRSRNLSLDRAADLANCSPATLDAALDDRTEE